MLALLEVLIAQFRARHRQSGNRRSLV
jgi:hypothetical protein